MEKKSLRWSIAQTPKRSRNYLNEGIVEEERKIKVITATRGHWGAVPLLKRLSSFYNSSISILG